MVNLYFRHRGLYLKLVLKKTTLSVRAGDFILCELGVLWSRDGGMGGAKEGAKQGRKCRGSLPAAAQYLCSSQVIKVYHASMYEVAWLNEGVPID